MHLNFLLKGAVIGFSIAAPVGPIGILCIRRSLADGHWIGLATGLGAATADAAYGCIAGFGLSAISSLLMAQRAWLGLAGGIFLCYLGIRTFLARPADDRTEIRNQRAASAYLSTFVLTLTNPMTILSFIAVFAGSGLGTSPDYLNASSLVAGVFAGSALWWLLLSGGVSLFRAHLSPTWMRAVNWLSGGILLAFGVYALSSFIFKGS